MALAALALYARTVGFGWVYDDQLEIVRNTFIRSFRSLPDMFSTTVWAGSGTESHLYRPLTLVTYATNYHISKLQPWSYHLVNILLHAGASVLVYQVGRLWRLSAAAAGLGGLLFALHPVHVEAVAAVFGRKDLLTAVFTLAMMLSHRTALARGGWRMLIPGLAYAGAMLSKEVGVVGLLLVAAQDWHLEGDPRRLVRRRRVIGLYYAYLLTLLLYLLARTSVVTGLGVPDTSFLDNPLVAASPAARLGTAIVVIGRGLALLAAPLTLSPDYSYDAIPLVRSALDWRLLATLGVLGLTGWSLTIRRVRRSVVPLGLLWYGIALFPASNLLVLVGTVFGERLLYLPSVAFCLLAGAGLRWLSRRHRPLAVVGTSVLLAAGCVQTVRYTGAWRDDISLFEWAVTAVPRSTKAHHKLGEELLRDGRLGEALRSLNRALAIAPENEFAVATLAVARRHVADRYWRPAPGGGEAAAPAADPDVLSVLGQISHASGAVAEAERYWQAALAADPEHPESLAGLGLVGLTQGDTTRAISYFEQAVRRQPSLASAWFELGRVHLARGARAEAIRALRHFVETAGFRYPQQQLEWARGVLDRWDAR